MVVVVKMEDLGLRLGTGNIEMGRRSKRARTRPAPLRPARPADLAGSLRPLRRTLQLRDGWRFELSRLRKYLQAQVRQFLSQHKTARGNTYSITMASILARGALRATRLSATHGSFASRQASPIFKRFLSTPAEQPR